MLQVGDARHLDLGRHRNLLFDIFCRMPRPLRDDVDVVIRYIWIGLNRQVMERYDAPCEEQNCPTQNKKPIVQRKVDDPPDHCASRVASNWSTFETTFWPEVMPERISCLFPDNIWPSCTSTRRHRLSSAGINTQSRSCRCKTADAGTAAWFSMLLLWNVAVTNIPTLRKPGLWTSTRTF